MAFSYRILLHLDLAELVAGLGLDLHLAAHLHALELTLGDGGGCATYGNGGLAGLDGVGVGGVEGDVELVGEHGDGEAGGLGVFEGVVERGGYTLGGVGALDVVPYIDICSVVSDVLGCGRGGAEGGECGGLGG